jgi:hypothetical protein
MIHAFSTSAPHRASSLGRHRHLAISLYAAVLSLLLGAVSPTTTQAAPPDANILFDYGFKGFTLGAEVGLSIGYLSAGNRFEEHEWRKLVVGVGIGALAGLASGIVVALADTSTNAVPVGYYMLRDAGYGTWIGAAVGALVGALLWIDDGRPRDLIQGAAYGTLFGAVAGLAFGIVEGKYSTAPSHRYYDDDWRYSVSPLPSSRSTADGLAVSVAKRF